MYLFAKRYVSCYDEKTKEIHKELQDISNKLGKGMGEANYIVTEAMYWRKFNAIHNWFVKNVQNGIDDCREYEVSGEKLEELLDVIDRCIEDNHKIPELLSPISGFFFGSVLVDEFFIERLNDTRDKLNYLINQTKDDFNYTFSYCASW